MISCPTASAVQRTSFGIGIACSNEAQNVGQLLAALARSWTAAFVPVRVVVVSDASRDGTDEIVRRFAADSAVPVLLEARPVRRGKAAAVNRIIELLDDVDVIVLVSADVMPEPRCLSRLLASFRDGTVGVAGGRVVVEGPSRVLAVRVSRLLWQLHHRIAQSQPKSTEITAFRNVGQRIDETSLVDEAELECELLARGFRVVYVPAARVRSMSPLTIRDYLQQRVRVTCGHLALARRRGYRVGTLSTGGRLRALVAEARTGELELATVVAAAALEAVVLIVAYGSRAWPATPLGRWRRVRSAKRPFRDER